MSELSETKIDNLSLLKATCLKFIYMFRNQLPDNFVAPFVDKVSDFLKSQHQVNQSYAAAVLEKLLLRKSHEHGGLIFTPQSVSMDQISKLL